MVQRPPTVDEDKFLDALDSKGLEPSLKHAMKLLHVLMVRWTQQKMPGCTWRTQETREFNWRAVA